MLYCTLHANKTPTDLFTVLSLLITSVFWLSYFFFLFYNFQFLLFMFAPFSLICPIQCSITYCTADVVILMKNKVIKKWKNSCSPPHLYTDACTGSCVAPDAVLFDFFRLPDVETGRSPAADHTKVHSH